MERIIQFEIPIPEDEAERRRYLALVWYELPAFFDKPARLKWPQGAGTPVHPDQYGHGVSPPWSGAVH